MCVLRASLYEQVPTGNPEVTKKDAQILYPNPATNAVNIALDNELYESVQIIDLTGKTVLRTNIDKNVTRLNVSHLQNGVYLVKTIGKQGVKTQKLVISR